MNNLKLFALIILFTIFSGIVFSQVTEEWNQRYNGPSNSDDDANSIAVDASGNIYVTGSSESTTGDDYATIKYNSSGVQLWVSRYNGPANQNDAANSIAVDPAGNVYVTGSSVGNGTLDDYATIKYNSSGVQQWVQRYDGQAHLNDDVICMAVDALGNVYVCGSSIESGPFADFITIKYNTSGLVEWFQRYNGPSNSDDGANSMAVDASGNVYVTGYSYWASTGSDITTIKYNSAGVMQWFKRYDRFGNGGDYGICVKLDELGNVYVAGHSVGSASNRDFATIKYNSSGALLWVQFYNGTGNSTDEIKDMALDVSGNIYITGRSIGSGTSDDYATVKYNSSGIQQWVQRYNGTGNSGDWVRCIAVDLSGDVYLTGYSTGIGTSQDYTTIKYSSSGGEQWVMKYNGPGNGGDAASGLFVDESYCVYVTGFSQGSVTQADYFTIKYSQPIGINQISSEIPERFVLGQNYPNPFNPTTNIEFALPKSSTVKIAVYDMLGREVEILVNKELKAGTYKTELNASNYTSGVYFYKLAADNFTQTKKMILVK